MLSNLVNLSNLALQFSRVRIRETNGSVSRREKSRVFPNQPTSNAQKNTLFFPRGQASSSKTSRNPRSGQDSPKRTSFFEGSTEAAGRSEESRPKAIVFHFRTSARTDSAEAGRTVDYRLWDNGRRSIVLQSIVYGLLVFKEREHEGRIHRSTATITQVLAQFLQKNYEN